MDCVYLNYNSCQKPMAFSPPTGLFTAVHRTPTMTGRIGMVQPTISLTRYPYRRGAVNGSEQARGPPRTGVRHLFATRKPTGVGARFTGVRHLFATRKPTGVGARFISPSVPIILCGHDERMGEVTRRRDQHFLGLQKNEPSTLISTSPSALPCKGAVLQARKHAWKNCTVFKTYRR